MEGQARIAGDVLARYAADAARDVPGVQALVGAVRVRGEGAGLDVEVHLAVDWGASIPEVGEEVQRRVAEYLERMSEVAPARVGVVVDGIGPAR